LGEEKWTHVQLVADGTSQQAKIGLHPLGNYAGRVKISVTTVAIIKTSDKFFIFPQRGGQAYIVRDAVHLIACNFAKGKPFRRVFFTGKLSNKFVNNVSLQLTFLTNYLHYTTL